MTEPRKPRVIQVPVTVITERVPVHYCVVYLAEQRGPRTITVNLEHVPRDGPDYITVHMETGE